MDIIKVKDLTKRYNKATSNAVDGVTFDVKEGEFFAFLGPNGAGKTTTISILTTTLSKTSGDITIAGFDIDKQSAKAVSDESARPAAADYRYASALRGFNLPVHQSPPQIVLR